MGESWDEKKPSRFAGDTPQIPHGLLFARDALGLDVEAATGIPPRLAGEVPDLGHLLDAGLRAEAAEQWPSWWRTVVHQEAAMHLGLGAEQLRAVADAPEWSSLNDRPALQAAARATFELGARWFETRRPPLEQELAMFEWRTPMDLAERVAAELGIEVGAISGCVLVFIVEGLWWELISPGVALCSFAATQDPETAETMQRSVFASGAPSGRPPTA